MSAKNTRHHEADQRMVLVERSDAIDAAGALMMMARDARKQARARHNSGPRYIAYRADLREAANIYDAAAERMQAAADSVVF